MFIRHNSDITDNQVRWKIPQQKQKNEFSVPYISSWDYFQGGDNASIIYLKPWIPLNNNFIIYQRQNLIQIFSGWRLLIVHCLVPDYLDYFVILYYYHYGLTSNLVYFLIIGKIVFRRLTLHFRWYFL